MPTQIDQFKLHWERFSAQFSLALVQRQTLYTLLLNAYTEPHRAYHTVQHIVECLEHFEHIKPYLHDPDAVEVAIWFHDVIYDPKAFDNELKSAELMYSQCSTFLNESTRFKIYQWIIATQKHRAPSDLDSSLGIDQYWLSDLHFVLDIDLSILGASKQRFNQYEKQIQCEYAWVDASIYRLKRAEVLHQFYQMQPIYQTAYFRSQKEQQAKLNIKNVIQI